MKVDDALNSPFIQNFVDEILVTECNNKYKEEIKNIMEALKNFKLKLNDSHANEESGEIQIDSTLAIMASKLLNPKEKEAIRSIYRYIDKSGDDKLGFDELQKGFKEIEQKILHDQ